MLLFCLHYNTQHTLSLIKAAAIKKIRGIFNPEYIAFGKGVMIQSGAVRP